MIDQHQDQFRDALHGIQLGIGSESSVRSRGYVIDQNGGYRDKDGNPIGGANPGKSPDAHIPYEDFVFKR